MSLKRPPRYDEQGGVLILVAISLVVLLGFAAIAVDGAAAWALRRQDQSAADTGAIAGALFTVSKDKATAIADATTEIIRITYNTVDPDMTAAEWNTEWLNCTDPAKPAIFTDAGVSDCISFTSNLNAVRVLTPDIPWKTTFAKVIGFDEIDTNAVAEVETELQANGGVLPFGMPGGTTGNVEICLKTGPNPKNSAPCDGPDTGNFGFLDFTQFGDPGAGIPAVCQGGNDRLENNIARGIDHPLGETSIYPVATSNHERDACNDGNINANPYEVDSETGNMAQALDDGFVDGTSAGYPGRLTIGPNVKVNVRGNLLDNKPLWDFLNGNGTSVCAPHAPFATKADIIACLSDPSNYTGGNWNAGVVFNSGGPNDIDVSPRFGWVPRLHENSFGPGNTDLTIADFQPVFIQTTYWKCNASGCDLEFDPGQPFGNGPNNVGVEAATAIAIPELALPQSLRDVAPGTTGQVAFLLSK